MFAKTATIKRLKRQLDAADWARSQDDLFAAEWQLRELLNELEEKEENAWLEFKENWKPGIMKRFAISFCENVFCGNLPNYCREEFLRTWPRERQLNLRARLNAVLTEQQSMWKRSQSE